MIGKLEAILLKNIKSNCQPTSAERPIRKTIPPKIREKYFSRRTICGFVCLGIYVMRINK